MPSTYNVPDNEPRRPTLMQSPSVSTLLGSPSTQWSNLSPRAATHASSLMVPLTAMSSSSPLIRNEIEPFGLPPLSARYSSTAATLQAIPPFMSTAPRPYRKPSLTSPANA